MNKGRFFISISSTFVLGAFLLMPTHAFASTSFTYVSGTITDSNNNIVVDANVSIDCNGHTQTALTNAAGVYQAAYTDGSQCPVGSTVNVTATKGALAGSGSGNVVQDPSNAYRGDATVNFSVFQNVSVPEFGFIPGMIAAVASAGSFFALKRKN